MCRALVALRRGGGGWAGQATTASSVAQGTSWWARSALGASDEPAGVGQRSPKLPARADAELGEHLA
jgi:hypothetical protein